MCAHHVNDAFQIRLKEIQKVNGCTIVNDCDVPYHTWYDSARYVTSQVSLTGLIDIETGNQIASYGITTTGFP